MWLGPGREEEKVGAAGRQGTGIVQGFVSHREHSGLSESNELSGYVFSTGGT